jgi:hypothetical protein
VVVNPDTDLPVLFASVKWFRRASGRGACARARWRAPSAGGEPRPHARVEQLRLLEHRQVTAPLDHAP